MLRFRRIRLLGLSVLLLAATVGVVVQLRKAAPPEAARLLPGADAFFYFNLQWARRATILTGLPQVRRTPEYERFIQESGVDFERDLEQAAFAVHYAAGGGEARYSEVLIGKLDAARLGGYFRRMASSTEMEQGVEIYSIPVEGHVLRAAILGPDMVAMSNHEDAGVIRGVVSRSRKQASPFGGPSFLRAYYKRVPFASMAWVIARVNPASHINKDGVGRNALTSQLPVDPAMLLEKPAVVVASARVLRAVHLRAEAITANDDEARGVAEKAGAMLALFRFSEAETPSGGPDVDVKEFFKSLQVTQEKEKAVLTATMPLGFLRKVFREPGAESEILMAPGVKPEEAKSLPKGSSAQVGAQTR